MNIRITYTFIKQLLHTSASGCFALLAPAFCAHCKIYLKQGVVLCEHCSATIQPVTSVALPLNKKYSIKVLAIGAYQQPLQQMILAKSWSDITASRKLGELIWQMTYAQHLPMDYLIPIPLHWQRLAKRGFNQADEMARALSIKSGKPVVHLLKRCKKTRFQSELSSLERAGNVQNVFTLQQRDITRYQGKHLVLVDDLMTTGATLQSAAKELLVLKPASMSALVACRVI